MIDRYVVACDPGGFETGIVLIDGGKVVDHDVLVRTDEEALELERDQRLPKRAYLLRVLERYKAMVEACPERPLMAVEGLVKPTPQMGYTSVLALVGTGMTFGAVVARFPVVVVRPGGHGKHDLRAYPPELQPARGQGKGQDVKRHARSAYDIALAARKARFR